MVVGISTMGHNDLFMKLYVKKINDNQPKILQ